MYIAYDKKKFFLNNTRKNRKENRWRHHYNHPIGQTAQQQTISTH